MSQQIDNLKPLGDQVWSDALLLANLLVRVKLEIPNDPSPVGRVFGGESAVDEICYTISYDVGRNIRESSTERS
jgi:hypothetical protein